VHRYRSPSLVPEKRFTFQLSRSRLKCPYIKHFGGFQMDEDRVDRLITQYREQIAQLEWLIKGLLLSSSTITTDGDVISYADWDS
jgi:hypothetical protein